MRTVKEASEACGVSIRTLQYYDGIGLLHPSGRTTSGYRLYSDEDLKSLCQILLFREVGFSLSDIKQMMISPGFNEHEMLDQQIALLKLKKDRIEAMIDMACAMRIKGVSEMDFHAFDSSKIDDYATKAKAMWQGTQAYQEFEKRHKGMTKEDEKRIACGLMDIFKRFGSIRHRSAVSEEARSLVVQLQSYITENYYTCTQEILVSLGQMYAAGGAFTRNIDTVGGEGTAKFANAAIQAYLHSRAASTHMG
ncbi:MAG: MerR family transcriptional regulator [Atopobiaceae bacterium]|jgi:DNA-binding transcriptional MerR regulator|nr:MerR family transcriptional regulator [Atopobium sp.]